MEIYLILQRLVSMPSVDNELGVQLYLKTLLEELGFEILLADVYPGRPNLWAFRGEGGPLIVTHADTFPQDDHADPFHLRDLDGKYTGRGALDAKGQIAALIKALSLSAKPCQILISVDEERGGRGSEENMPPSQGAIVLEPTGFGIAVAQAGFVETEVTVRGKSAHGAVPEAGSNAILKAFELYRRLSDLSFMKTSHPLFPAPWINLQTIRGGDPLNSVPSTCVLQTDMSILPGVDLSEASEELSRFLESEGTTYRLIDSSPAFEIDRSARVVSTLEGAFQQYTRKTPRLVGMRSWTDAANIVKQGIPAVVFGAGDLALAHSDREELDADELDTLANILATLVDLW